MSIQTIMFLSKAPKIIPNECSVASILRSHLINKCRDIVSQQGETQLNKHTFGSKVMCQQCGNLWSDGKACVRVKEKRPLSRLIKRLMRKNPKPNTRAYSILEQYKKNNSNVLIRICTVCKYVNKESLPRPELKNETDKNVVPAQVTKKKKKKRDNCAGLNEKLVKRIKMEKQSTQSEIEKPKTNYNRNNNNAKTKQNKQNSFNKTKNQTPAKVYAQIPKANKKSELSKFLKDAKLNYSPVSSLQNFFDKLT